MTVASSPRRLCGHPRPSWAAVLRALAWGAAGVVLGGLLIWPRVAWAQAPLSLVNEETTVREVSFKFVDGPTFSGDALRAQIATQAPSFWTRVKQAIPLLFQVRTSFAFDPLTLQRDVVRLRQFYRRNGFLKSDIDYPASQLDTTANAIHVIFTITEGPPVIIQDAGFFGPDSARYAVRLFDGALRKEWVAFRDATGFEVGSRYTAFRQLRIEDDVRTWMRNQGFAFATVASEARLDTAQSTADIRFFLDPGPRGRIDTVQVYGNESVSDGVVRRELPLRVGDRFSAARLQEGQRQLFGLNLFRVAIADVPEQPRDSTVTVRYRVREGDLRLLSAQVGYGTDVGTITEAQWTHRNFFGAARTFSASLLAETGFLAAPGFLPDALITQQQRAFAERRFRSALTLRQPYVFANRLSASVEPFLEYRRDNKFEEGEETLGINARDFGLNTTLLYDLADFRTVSLRHAFTRSLQFTQVRTDAPPGDDGPGVPTGGVTTATNDLFNRSVFTLSASLGETDDVLSPTRGVVVRPSAEFGGAVLRSDLEYLKGRVEVSGYLPLGTQTNLAGRVTVGALRALGRSRTALRGDLPDAGDNQRFENRFDPVLFYAGGTSDLRGWVAELAGAKLPRPVGAPVGADSLGANDVLFEPLGGTAKLGASVEMRLPFPGLGANWRTAAFVDVASVRGTVFPPVDTLAFDPDRLVRADLGRNAVRVGAGLGIRYKTPVGFLRVDVAYKVNPGPFDLRPPLDVYRFLTGERDTFPEPGRINRFRLHIGIGQAF